ncbi:MAG: transglycosylase SLT domain-containing protein, partial [Mariprofundaceae bacterium]|nr:transglycosylase SLT domain-containing protein [Mariprofundaceae bacterium]
MLNQKKLMLTLCLISTLLMLGACSHATKTSLASLSKNIKKPTATLENKHLNTPKDTTFISQDAFLQGLLPQDIARAQASAKKHILPHWPRIMKRSTFVRQRLIDTLASMNAPLSLQLIPIVESGYQPYALSRTGAMGLWQLMPGTAQHLGIKKNPYRDGRRDVEKSTRAAVTYLQTQYKRFGNWPLAFAAYNMGPYGLAKRLRKTAWTLDDGLENMPVPIETRNYVRQIIGLTALFNMQTIAFPDPIPTQTMTLHAPVDLKQLANSSKLPKLLLFQINPGLHYSQYLRHDITIHAPKKNLLSLQKQQKIHRPKHIKIKVQSGDSLWKLAHQHHTNVTHLHKLNPKLPRTLKIGMPITVPAYSFARATAASNPLLSQGRRIRYKVHKGDSLWSISRRFGTSTHAISRANQLSKNAIIRPGDRL